MQLVTESSIVSQCSEALYNSILRLEGIVQFLESGGQAIATIAKEVEAVTKKAEIVECWTEDELNVCRAAGERLTNLGARCRQAYGEILLERAKITSADRSIEKSKSG